MNGTRLSFLVDFLTRSCWPVVAFILFLSIGLNAFFLTLERYQEGRIPSLALHGTESATTTASIDSLARGPQAFGAVQRGFAVRSNPTPVPATLHKISHYDSAPDALPVLPAVMTLYRDQGIDIESALMSSVFAKFGAPYNLSSLKFYAKTLTFRSADHSMQITLDADTRLLTVEKLFVSSYSGSTIADDAESIALARDFSALIGFPVDTAAKPRIIEKTDSDGKQQTFVSWDESINDIPLLDTDLQPVSSSLIQINRSAHRAVLATISLLKPGLLARSDYPTSAQDPMKSLLENGGLLPFPATLPSPAISVSYQRVDLAYMVYSGDEGDTTYILPILRASGTISQSCDGCAPIPFSTFVPALDAASFAWVK